MPKRTWIIPIGALLLAGFTATVADAGETRRAGSRVVVSGEDEDGRKVRRSPRPTARPTVPQKKPHETRPTRRPAAAPEKARRPQHVVPGHLHRRPASSRVVTRHPERRPPSRVVTRHPVRPPSRVVTRHPVRPPVRVVSRHPVRPPVRVVSRHPVRPPVRRWIPGHYEERVHQVWVPGHYRTKYVPARYETRRGWFGITWRYQIAPARTKKVWVAGHYRDEVQRVWIPGQWTRLPPTRHGYRPHR